MRWQLTPYFIPLLLAAVISMTLALYTWQRRRGTPAATSFALMMLIITEWTLGYTLEVGSTDLAGNLFWAKVEYIGIVSVPLAWLAFALQYSNRTQWLTPRNLVLSAIVPVITLLLVWTNEAHGLVWRRAALDTSGPFPALAVSYGPWFWVHLAFSYVFLLLGTILLIRIALGFPRLYRLQAGLLLLGTLAPWLSNGLYLFSLTPVPHLDLTPFAFTLTGLAAGWNLFHYRFLDIVPVARRAIVEGMPDGVIVLDVQNRIVDVNPAAQQIIGREAVAMIGQLADQVLALRPDLIERYRDVLEASAEIVLGEGETRRYFDLRISPLYKQPNELSGRLIVLRDVTERKQTEVALALAHDQALAASRLKTELLAKVSHELRTPLGAILGFTEMLEFGVFGPLSEQQQQATAQVIDSTHYLTTLVNELLDQAQLDAGKLKLNLSPFVPAELVENTLSKMKVLAQMKGLSLTTTLAPDMPATLVSDPDRIQQILVNLVGNAIKFTQFGAVKVSLYQPDPAHWTLQVSDTGPGIPPEAQSYIFEPFRQIDGSITRVHTGTGMGLSIVKQLTTTMGGEITLESEIERGSTFTIVLPLEPVQNKSVLT